MPGTDPKATSDSGGVKPFTNINGYDSPWDINNVVPVQHYFQCHLFSQQGVYTRVTPYIGLAYYDGANDGIYNGVNLAGGYPNLYAGGNEYGNYIAANPIVLTGTSSTHELAVFSDWVTPQANDHCPVMPSVYQYPYNPEPIFFDLVNNNMVKPAALGLPPITPPSASATPQEVQLLKDFGKVMYYKIEFGSNPTVFTDTFYVLGLQDDSGDAIQNSLSVTDTFGGDLYWHISSREIIVDPTTVANPDFVVSGGDMPTAVGSFRARTSYLDGFVRLYIE
ncbi:hypothetical protein MG290_11015 [Flavobacterium sp. CBA20B-1]|uniref:hypothetical protein n=1 Tax=unclassified Flavobacterium TaxID=196869 RepID=UPI002224B717|nr:MULTISPECIES: hypothetical protein [unclassified Flavobacterium]WCM41477.1 hypothetical protein MG290_11015 [Flavobacterium sp. CBA20B-1]